ncbi:MAG: 50S ribosomal protein L29 [Candidatus Omnitrophica bacterium]|nr:50S ribosomal protein L29 [Candidatus Omnitrophota bacterium]MBI2174065.1 50S ribosomal protein L29 [Candidatus Omnitrophota bacterium]MBI3010666.1 50S ribosomal protein L29 [Candidatus Omnitrophota bacterium]
MAKATSESNNLRTLSVPELNSQLDTLRREFWQQRLKVREGALPQTHLLKQSRRQIARIQTALRQQQQAVPASKASS